MSFPARIQIDSARKNSGAMAPLYIGLRTGGLAVLLIRDVERPARGPLAVDHLPAVAGLHALPEPQVPLALTLTDAVWIMHG